MIESLLRNFDTMLLFVFAFLSLLGAVNMLIFKHPMRVAMALISTMVCLGAIYGLVGVHFIAAFQVLIYVSAVMVFVVYVIMLLDVRDLSFTHRYSRFVVGGIVGGVLLFGGLAVALWRTVESPLTGSASFSLAKFAVDFVGEYWLQFEVTSVLLVAAVVAAIAVVKADQRDHG